MKLSELMIKKVTEELEEEQLLIVKKAVIHALQYISADLSENPAGSPTSLENNTIFGLSLLLEKLFDADNMPGN